MLEQPVFVGAVHTSCTPVVEYVEDPPCTNEATAPGVDSTLSVYADPPTGVSAIYIACSSKGITLEKKAEEGTTWRVIVAVIHSSVMLASRVCSKYWILIG